MSELSFLIDLLLTHKLPKATQLAIKGRITYVETLMKPQPQPQRPPSPQQAPSMQAAIQALEDGIPANAIIPNTGAAAQALQHRNQVIAQALSGREEQGRTSPRKF